MRRETVLMLRSIFIGELHTLHCTKKERRYAPLRSDRESEGIRRFGLDQSPWAEQARRL